MRGGGSLRSPGEHLHLEREKEVLENLEETAHGLPLDLALPRHVTDVQHPAVGEAHGLQEAGEVADVPDPPFHPNLFLQVEARVGPEYLRRVRRGHNQRHHALLQGWRQVEARELRCHEGMAGPDDGPSCQKIHSTPTELPGTGACEDEGSPGRALEEVVDHIEQLGDSLYFVQDHRTPVRGTPNQLGEPLRARTELPKGVRLEKVYE